MNDWSDYVEEARDAYDNVISPGHYADSSKSLINSMAITRYNAAEQEKAWQRQIDLIREQNAYNSPSAQMQRYAEAGLNPLLMYGQITPGQQTALAEYQANRTDPGSGKVTKQQEIFGRAMQALSMVQSIIGTATDVAGSIEGLQTQRLQNDILRNERDMSDLTTHVNKGVYNLYEGLNHEGFNIVDMFKSVFLPGLAKQDATYSKIDYDTARTQWQNWYNENFAPLLHDYEKNKVGLSNYELNFLETMPPEMRQMYMLFLPLLKLIK